MNDDFKLLRTSVGFLPADIPQSFWDVIEQANGDSIKLRSLLAPLEQERLYEFYKTYFEAQLELPYHLADEHSDAITGATEDTLEDLGISVVALGRAAYEAAWDRGVLPPEETWEDLPLLLWPVHELYEEKFGESPYERVCEELT